MIELVFVGLLQLCYFSLMLCVTMIVEFSHYCLTKIQVS